MKLILVNTETKKILSIEDASDNTILDPMSSWEEVYYITSVDTYKVGDVYRFD